MKSLFTIKKSLVNYRLLKKTFQSKECKVSLKKKKIKSFKLNSIINNSKFKNKQIDFLNIDVEGADFETLKSLDFTIYNPKIICIEIIDKNILNSEIYNFLKNLNYKKIWSSKSNFNHIFVK